MDKTRREHLQWCKDRAGTYLDAGDPAGDPVVAFASFSSDVGKHPDTASIRSNPLMSMGLMETGSVSGMQRFIED